MLGVWCRGGVAVACARTCTHVRTRRRVCTQAVVRTHASVRVDEWVKEADVCADKVEEISVGRLCLGGETG